MESNSDKKSMRSVIDRIDHNMDVVLVSVLEYIEWLLVVMSSIISILMCFLVLIVGLLITISVIGRLFGYAQGLLKICLWMSYGILGMFVASCSLYVTSVIPSVIKHVTTPKKIFALLKTIARLTMETTKTIGARINKNKWYIMAVIVAFVIVNIILYIPPKQMLPSSIPYV